jgi:hypothetical protein
VNGRAFLAIIRRSLDRRFAATWLLGFGCAFALGRFAPAFMTHTGWLVTLLAIGAPTSPFDRRNTPRRRISFFAMPLYGRELARALAVEPCLAWLGRHPFALDTAVTILVAVLTSALVGLSAIVRTGENAALYIALALVAEAAIVTPLVFRPAHPLLFTLPIALALAFVALRAFGETLARYGPLPA